MLQNPSEVEVVVRQYAAATPAESAATIASAVTKPIGVKQLLMVLEMARSEGMESIDPEHFIECLHTIGF
jgi:hypothetical protein